MAGEIYDVIVVGAGNAGLTAALAARQRNARAAFGKFRKRAGRKHPLFRRRFSLHVQQSGRHASDAARLDGRRSGENGCRYLFQRGILRRCHAGDRVCRR